jgi:hypothetical protein
MRCCSFSGDEGNETPELARYPTRIINVEKSDHFPPVQGLARDVSSVGMYARRSSPFSVHQCRPSHGQVGRGGMLRKSGRVHCSSNGMMDGTSRLASLGARCRRGPLCWIASVSAEQPLWTAAPCFPVVFDPYMEVFASQAAEAGRISIPHAEPFLSPRPGFLSSSEIV